MSHAVVLREPEVPAAHAGALADALAQVTGMARLDALQQIKRVEGILLDNVDTGKAKALADAAREIGVEAGVAPTDAATRYKRRILVRRAECADAGLRLQDGQAWKLASWETIRAGSLTLYREPKEARGGAPRRGIGGALGLAMVGTLGVAWAPAAYSLAQEVEQARNDLQRSTRLASEENYVLDLFADPGVTLRVEARKFHYGYLKERMHERFELNFHALVADIAARAKGAVLAPATRKFLKGSLLVDVAVTDLHDFDHFNRWFLLSAAAFRSP